MIQEKSVWLPRIWLGGGIGAVLAPLLVYFLGGGLLGADAGHPVFAFGIPYFAVLSEMANQFGAANSAALAQSLLGGGFGAVVASSTLPFAGRGKELVWHSLIHFIVTEITFSLLLSVCRWANGFTLWVYMLLLAILYLLIWLGRWVGWYIEVMQLRQLLGLEPGPSPLKWRETVPYLPVILLGCVGIPLGLRGVEFSLGTDIPVLTGAIYPFLLLPAVCFCMGLFLGKRKGMCPLYPVAVLICSLPALGLLLNSSALFFASLAAVFALAGDLVGWGYSKVMEKKKGNQIQ
ncbi:MAG: DUF3021 family protein [Lawsonibacter sp.]|jgi:hypothetical protein